VNSNEPLIEVALLAAFGDQAAFSRAFSKMTGLAGSLAVSFQEAQS
jgi:AraC-like DNA-binding protein